MSMLTYYFCDDQIMQDQLVFKGYCLVFLAALHKEMMAAVHASHTGMEDYISRAEDSMYWPCMTTKPEGVHPHVQ